MINAVLSLIMRRRRRKLSLWRAILSAFTFSLCMLYLCNSLCLYYADVTHHTSISNGPESVSKSFVYNSISSTLDIPTTSMHNDTPTTVLVPLNLLSSLPSGSITTKTPKVIAIYFPQFHTDPLNDRIWGTGFTDWDNLRKAPSHNRLGLAIPRPTELGYYDLTHMEPRRAQGQLARQYGIDGFMYHHYWFYDTTHPGPNLHQPLMRMLEDGHPDVAFFFNWCTEPWTRRWHTNESSHAEDHTIPLQAQYYPPPDDPAVRDHYEWLKRFFDHKNYIQVDGAPVFMIYAWSDEMEPILKQFIDWAKEDLFTGLYIMVTSFERHFDFRSFRNAMDTPPVSDTISKTVSYPFPVKRNSNRRWEIPKWCTALLNTNVTYATSTEVVSASNATSNTTTTTVTTTITKSFSTMLGVNSTHMRRKKWVMGLLSSFDNTPRRKYEDAFVWTTLSPAQALELFTDNLYTVMYYESCCFPHQPMGDDSMILINAMNEWAEGMALEPSDVYGRRFLEAIYAVKLNVSLYGCISPF
jgi:hypothetical protein